MDALPLISVVVPVYNVAPYLDRCIRSLTEQSYTRLEILLVDDGSQDGSGAICDAWAAKDSRIRVIHKENGGAGQARNVGMDRAKGTFLGLVDSDDYLDTHFYSHLYSLMDEETDIAECEILWTGEDEAPLESGEQAAIRCCTMPEAMELHIREEMFCQTPPNKLYRMSAVGNARFPVGNLIDDEFWTYQVIGASRKLVHSSAKMYAYRQQSSSAMHKPYSLRRLQGLEARQQRLEYLRKNLPELEETAKNDLFLACIYCMQSCLRHLEGQERQTGIDMIRTVADTVTPLTPDPRSGIKRKLLIMLGQRSLTTTAKALNLLIDLHILT